MTEAVALPGFLAGTRLPEPPRGPVTESSVGPVTLWHWGLVPAVDEPLSLIVSRMARRTGGRVPADEISRLLQSDPAALTDLLPPFGAVVAQGSHATAVADSMGFQHLFRSTGDSTAPSFLTNSCLVAGRATNAPLDEVAVAVQSLLGWQLGQRTLLGGIGKLEPGAVARLDEGGVTVTPPSADHSPPIDLERAVVEAAALLRHSLEAVLDDYPDAVLQLTGGMDSRLLLSAIPEARRRGLRAMTLEVPGTGDVEIAGRIAERYGLRHEVHGLNDLSDVSPEEAWALASADSSRLDAMADPIALAAQRIAERAFDQGVRISGLGGEIARGFYYVGKVRDRSYTRADAERLAAWRMFVNEAVEPGLLTPEFAGWAKETANQQVHEALLAGGSEWYRAADELYVRHRMQRWAGATDTAVSDQRTVLNPMLDAGFLSLAARLTPQDKAGSRFLAALQMELDPELGRLPLEGRPPPAVYANPPWWQPSVNAASLGQRVVRKGLQRLRRGNRPPAGGTVMATKVVELIRARPEVIETVASLDFIRDEWIAEVLEGQIEPRPSSVAFLTNLVSATRRG